MRKNIAMKLKHEIRDPVHGFITLSRLERRVMDSWPFQRLRHIHQLAMTYLVYPGATHRRFEHSLGVMELAARVYKTITEPSHYDTLPEHVRTSIPEAREDAEHWYKTLRMAALCHDLGHLPFSHANENLLPSGYTHERMTWEIIHGPDLAPLWDEMHLKADEIGKLALGAKEMNALGLDADFPLSTWEALLAEITVGDAFGVDRMDYLLRDSRHLGVSYGLFDLDRVLQGLRIAYSPPQGEGDENQSWEPAIGIERGALHAAAALLWARHAMFSQVYFHHVRRIYDMHLQDFMQACHENGFPIEYEPFLALTDNEVLAQLRHVARVPGAKGHDAAKRLTSRGHFRCVYQQTHADAAPLISHGITTPPALILADALREQFGEHAVKDDTDEKKHKNIDFPVLQEEHGEGVLLASQEMPTINSVPNVETGYIFVRPDLCEKAASFLDRNKKNVLEDYHEDKP